MNDQGPNHVGAGDDDRIVDFVHGLLSPQEHRAVLARAGRDREFEDRLRWASAALERARSHRAADLQGRVSARRGRERTLVAMLATAAVLALLLQPVRREAEEPLPAAWIPVETEFVHLRSASGQVSALAKGLQAYRRRDAGEAIALLQPLSLPEGLDDLRRVVLASALVVHGDPDAAASELRGLDVPTLPQPWRDRAQWVSYLILRRQDRDVQADAILRTLETTEGDIGRRARIERERRGP
jgi:hypothetical protein